jgi:hypothetical protein
MGNSDLNKLIRSCRNVAIFAVLCRFRFIEVKVTRSKNPESWESKVFTWGKQILK